MQDIWEASLKSSKSGSYTAPPPNPFGSSKILGIPQLPESEIDIPF